MPKSNSAESEGRLNYLANEIKDINQNLENMDRQIQKMAKNQGAELESVRTQIINNLQQKADLRDLESVNQRLHGKIDLDRLQSAILELRAELNNGLSLSKKDSMTSLKKKEDDFKSLKGELENLENKAHKEISSLQDKLVKLAAQFDKELVMRDKQIK